MNRALGVALLVVGAVLIGYGIDASESLASDFSRFFDGTPTDKTMWLLLSGVAAVIVGFFLSFFRSRRA